MLGRRRAFRYDRRRMLFTRKSAESACWSGGAAARAGGRAIGGQTTGFGWTKRPISATGPDIGTNEDVTCRSGVATTRWSQASSSWVPSSPVQQSWQTSPQSSGSSLQKQRTVPPRTAAKARAPAATSATHPRTRPLLFIIDLIIPKNRMARRSVPSGGLFGRPSLSGCDERRDRIRRKRRAVGLVRMANDDRLRFGGAVREGDDERSVRIEKREFGQVAARQEPLRALADFRGNLLEDVVFDVQDGLARLAVDRHERILRPAPRALLQVGERKGAVVGDARALSDERPHHAPRVQRSLPVVPAVVALLFGHDELQVGIPLARRTDRAAALPLEAGSLDVLSAVRKRHHVMHLLDRTLFDRAHVELCSAALEGRSEIVRGEVRQRPSAPGAGRIGLARARLVLRHHHPDGKSLRLHRVDVLAEEPGIGGG